LAGLLSTIGLLCPMDAYNGPKRRAPSCIAGRIFLQKFLIRRK
jgi:hypothetical protein